MKTLKILFAALFISFGSTHLSAQSSVEYKVSFDKEGNLTSEEYALEEETENPFARITAYTLQEDIEASLYYRVRLNKEWSEWKPFASFTEGYTEGRTSFDGGILEEGFNGIQFKSTETHTEEFVFRVYYPNSIKKKSEVAGIKKGGGANCSCPQPPVCLRNCWCPSNNCPKDATPDYTRPDHIIVHHSAGTNNSSNWMAVVSSIWDFHVNTNGWDDIGYNWLIDPDGVIYEGRGDSVQGAHFSCMNTETTGICLLGNFVSTAPADSAISSLIKMVAWEGCYKNIAPATSSFHNSSQLLLPNVAGHRHGNASTAPNSCAVGTVCPGDSLFTLLPMIRDSAAAFTCLGDVSIKETSLPDDLMELYPNPAQNTLTIKPHGFEGGYIELQVLDHTGSVVIIKEVQLSSLKRMEVSVDFLPKGIFLVLLSQNGITASKQFIKN